MRCMDTLDIVPERWLFTWSANLKFVLTIHLWHTQAPALRRCPSKSVAKQSE